MEDKQIIDLFLSRSESAISETGAKYGGRLMRMAENMLSSREDAEECVNDALYAMWDTVPPKQPENIFPYLSRICRNLIFNRIDRVKAKKRSSEVIALTEELSEIFPDKKYDFACDGREIGQALDTFLKTLDDEPLLLFYRRYWYGDSIKEIAFSLHISQSKVKVTLFRIRQKLKIYLESEGIYL